MAGAAQAPRYPLRFSFDESGDFGYPNDSYDCYVIAGVICPESVQPRLDSLVDRLKIAFNVDELHATKMNDEQRLSFAKGLANLDIRFVAMATDTNLDSKESIRAFRFAQADNYQQGGDRYAEETVAIGMLPDVKIKEFTDRAVKRAAFESRVSDSEIVQTHYMLELIQKSLQCSLFVFHDNRWRPAFSEMRFEIDAKLKEKLSSGEKMLEDVLMPSLGSRAENALGIVETWNTKPPHPFIQKYQVKDVKVGHVRAESGFDLRKIFEHGLTFIDSERSAGVQAADLVAYSLRRAVLHPGNRNAQTIASTLLPLSFNDGADSIGSHIVRLGPTEGDDQDLSRFRPIALTKSREEPS